MLGPMATGFVWAVSSSLDALPPTMWQQHGPRRGFRACHDGAGALKFQAGAPDVAGRSGWRGDRRLTAMGRTRPGVTIRIWSVTVWRDCVSEGPANHGPSSRSIACRCLLCVEGKSRWYCQCARFARHCHSRRRHGRLAAIEASSGSEAARASPMCIDQSRYRPTG